MDSTEAFYTIINNNENDDTTASLSVTVNVSMMMTVQSSTAYMRRFIPIDGFEMVELTQIADMLGVDRFELASRLVASRNQGGITLDLIRELGNLYNFNLWIQQEGGIFTYEFVPVQVVMLPPPAPVIIQAPVFNPQLITVVAVIPTDEACSICLQTNNNNNDGGWSTAAGCSLHRFHSDCIRQWTRGTCPMCRAPLLRRT
jgi:hypothetical protein